MKNNFVYCLQRFNDIFTYLFYEMISILKCLTHSLQCLSWRLFFQWIAVYIKTSLIVSVIISHPIVTHMSMYQRNVRLCARLVPVSFLQHSILPYLWSLCQNKVLYNRKCPVWLKGPNSRYYKKIPSEEFFL